MVAMAVVGTRNSAVLIYSRINPGFERERVSRDRTIEMQRDKRGDTNIGRRNA